MKLVSLLTLGGSLLGPITALNRFFVDQCECPIGEFTSVFASGGGESNEFGQFEISNLAGFNCIADKRGVVKDLSADVISSIDGTIQPAFFNNGGERAMWYGVIDIDLNDAAFDDPQSFDLLTITFPNGEFKIRVTTDVVQVNGSPLGIASFEETGLLGVDISTEFRAIRDLNRISFGEFRGIPGYGGGDVFGYYICYQTVVAGSDFIECSIETSSADQIGTINQPVTVSFANEDSPAINGAYRIESFAFEQSDDLDFTAVAGAVLEDDDAETLANAIILDDPPLPVFLDTPIPAVEDIDLVDVDIRALLSDSTLGIDITIDDPLVIDGKGTLSTFNGSAFALFDPVDNAFDEAPFSFSYTSTDVAYTCVLSVDNAIIDIESAEDVPTLVVVEDQQSIAFVGRDFSVEVADSIDFPVDGVAGTLLVGFVRIATLPTAGTLFQSGCGGNAVEVDDVFTLVDGNFEFCYQGDGGNTAGSTDSFTYTVRPESDDVGNQAVGEGTITLLGGNPVVPNPNVVTRSEQFTEGGANQALTVAAGVFALLEDGVDNFAFQIEVVTIPDAAVGVFSVGGTPIAVDQVIDADVELTFTPAANFFNANAIGGATNDADVDIFGIGCNAAEKVNGVCPDVSFTYRVLFGDPAVPSEVVNFGIIVAAVDGAGADFEAEQDVDIIANSNNARNGFILVNGADIQVSSDGGGNVFNIGVRFVGVGGALIRLPTSVAGDPVGIPRPPTDAAVSNCINQGCDAMHLIGTPGQLNDFLSRVEYDIPVEEQGAPPRVDISLASGENFNTLSNDDTVYDQNNVVAVEFDVQAVDEGFFDDPQNVAIVAGSAGGCMLLVLIVVIVKATTVNSVNGERVKKLDETGPKKFKQRGGVVASKDPKKKRSFEESDGEDEENPPAKATGEGDPLLDWEKHIDPKTKEPFYHNTRTNKTVWELPEGL